jgi:hypothetical protein
MCEDSTSFEFLNVCSLVYIPYLDVLTMIQVGYQSKNVKHVFDRKLF